MDRELEMIGLSVAILVIAIAILVLAVLHRRRLNQVSDQLAEGAVDNGETLKGVVEKQGDATRKHVSNAVDAMRSDTKLTKQRLYDFVDQQTKDSNEHRGQLTGIKERVQHLIKVADEWLHHRKPPP